MLLGGGAGVFGNGEVRSGLEACSDPLAGDLAGFEYLIRVFVGRSAGYYM
jgi:hypothetical protein